MSQFNPIRDGSPELAEWLRTHPVPIVLRAKFDFPALPVAIVAKQRIPDWPCDQAGRPWPADKGGRPWPRDRWDNPGRPLHDYPPGVAAPGTAPFDPYDANSPSFNPVLVLQKVGILPADLSGAVQQTPPAVGIPDRPWNGPVALPANAPLPQIARQQTHSGSRDDVTEA